MQKIIKLSLATILGLSLFIGCGETETLEDGENAYQKKEYDKAISIFKNLANKGDLEAQIKLAKIYRHGEKNAIEKNEKKAIEYYTKAALQGDINSVYNLSALDKKAAKEISIKKAKEDNDKYLTILINEYLKDAIPFLEDKANTGDIEYQFRLGDIYINGVKKEDSEQNIEKDLVKASYWYEKSAKDDDYISQMIVANKYFFQNAESKFNEWMNKAIDTIIKQARADNTNAQINLGLIYDRYDLDRYINFIFPKSDEKPKFSFGRFELSRYISNIREILNNKLEDEEKSPIYWLEKASNLNDEEAQKELISLYNSYGKYYNTKKANEWIEKLANHGNTFFQNILAKSHYDAGNYKTSFYWYEKSANQGSNVAQYNLGILYLEGIGIEEKDYKKAIELFEKSAEQGYTDAQTKLGDIYITGKIVELDKKKAYHYWSMAKEKDFRASRSIENLCADPFNAEICKNEK